MNIEKIEDMSEEDLEIDVVDEYEKVQDSYDEMPF